MLWILFSCLRQVLMRQDCGCNPAVQLKEDIQHLILHYLPKLCKKGVHNANLVAKRGWNLNYNTKSVTRKPSGSGFLQKMLGVVEPTKEKCFRHWGTQGFRHWGTIYNSLSGWMYKIQSSVAASTCSDMQILSNWGRIGDSGPYPASFPSSLISNSLGISTKILIGSYRTHTDSYNWILHACFSGTFNQIPGNLCNI